MKFKRSSKVALQEFRKGKYPCYHLFQNRLSG